MGLLFCSKILCVSDLFDSNNQKQTNKQKPPGETNTTSWTSCGGTSILMLDCAGPATNRVWEFTCWSGPASDRHSAPLNPKLLPHEEHVKPHVNVTCGSRKQLGLTWAPNTANFTRNPHQQVSLGLEAFYSETRKHGPHWLRSEWRQDADSQR